MNNIYDNGALLLGKATDIIKYWNEHYDEDLEEIEDIIKDLKELIEINDTMIVCINYENGMGYTLDYWDEQDIIDKEK